MIIAVDIGNTSTMVGLYENGHFINQFRTPSKDDKNFTVVVNADMVAPRLQHMITESGVFPEKVEGMAVCSVVPELTAFYLKMSETLTGKPGWELDYRSDLGLGVMVDKPSQVGPDRLANAVAVKNLFGHPAIVVDLGTSTNFDVVNAEGDYIGGAIAPGVKTSSAELFRRASRLFPIELEKPSAAIGKNTTDAMKSGIFYGSLGLIDKLLSMIIAELEHPDIKVIATGGYAELFAPHSQYIQTTDALLTLKGIVMAYERNH